MGIFQTIKSRIPFSFHIKGLEQNRTELPKGGMYSGSASGDYYGDILSAIRGVNVGRSKIDYVQEAGDLAANSIVALCLGWMGTTWPQAPVRVGRIKDGKPVGDDTTEKHPVLSLLRRPNSMYRGSWLRWAINNDFWTTGNGYCHIVTDGRNNLAGTPRELEWLPTRLVEPMPDSTGRLAHYKYSANGKVRLLDPKEVIHFRFGVDPSNPLRGISPLLAQAAYMVADRCGGEYGAGLLYHGGLPPAILVPEPPKDGGGRALTQELAQQLTDDLNEGLQSEPGKIRLVGGAVKLVQLGFNPAEMAINELMELPETRIPAAFGIPPEVLKLRVGLMHSTENNIEMSQKAGWRDCLAPTQDIFAEEWTEALLHTRFEQDESLVVFYDRSEVGVLKPDMNASRETAAKMFTAGMIDRADAKTTGGYTPKPEDEGVYHSAPSAPIEPDPAKEPTPPTKPAQKKTLIDTR